MVMDQPPAPVEAATQLQALRDNCPVQRDNFDVFYTVEMPALTVFLMHQGASPYEAADAAHEAMSKLLPHRWRTMEHPRAYLRVVAQRCYWRQNDVRVSPSDAVPDRPGGTCPVSEVLLDESQQHILDALQQLTPALRTVMAWSMDGFTYEEIAEALDKSPAAVRQCVSRARKQLAVLLELDKGDAHE